MSLPVTRRIARAALLVAASAAPVAAVAGTASAADLPKAPDLGGLTTLDSAGTSENLDHTAKDAIGVVNTAGHKAAETLAPALIETGGAVIQQAAPTTQKAADAAEGLVRRTAKKGISTDTLVTEAAKGLLGGLPLGQTALKGLPVNGLLGG
ncbi:ATP-binding protein [Streptomyces celluloflavus]|uniref:ATP-binding protein n=2 Tax=Streptomyces TaxID=1883 RepID=A0A4Q9HQA5_STRKA|nr:MULTISPECIES: ATP-binding protein [Streptomyces]MYU53599.1 ATP-binding protein [Streptomyces sp. SID7805]TBO57114.1 ATP-binding protein [Streptomyces kasugaensis]WSK14901.1 ATP-binding protein [Streptomyces celluloflavus]